MKARQPDPRNRRPAGEEPKGPELLGEILSRLITARGWGQRNARRQLEEAWLEAIGPRDAEHTRVGGVRRGVLEILVDNAVLLQELTGFRKRSLLEALRQRLPRLTLQDVRFRSGTWQND